MAVAALGVTWVGAVVPRHVDSFTRHALVKAVRAERCLFLCLASCRMPSPCKAESPACILLNTALGASLPTKAVSEGSYSLSSGLLSSRKQAGFSDRAAARQGGRKRLKAEDHQLG